MTSQFAFAGDVVAAPLELPLRPAPDRSPDVTISLRLTDHLPVVDAEEILHRGELGGAPWQLATAAHGDGWVMSFGLGCQASLSPDASIIELRALDHAPADWIAEAISGWALVYRAAVCGRPMFHASAVSFDSTSVIAVCGPGGSGKSTTAAAAIARGASLLADDVLAVQFAADPAGRALVHSTASGVKLRGIAQRLATRIDGAASTTFDERLRLDAVSCADELPLQHVVFLDPDAESGLHPIDPADVAVRLLANSKIGDWTWAQGRDREFEWACEIANRVDGYSLGRPSEAGSPEDLLAVADQLRTL